MADTSGGKGSGVDGVAQLLTQGPTGVLVGAGVCVDGGGGVSVGGGIGVRVLRGGHVAVGGTPVAGGVGDGPTTGVGVGPITSFRGSGIFSPGGAETFPHFRCT